MNKLFLQAAFLFLAAFQSYAQNPAPETFLGYAAGKAFTYHHRIVDYVEALAEKNPERVKLIPYGTTPEGRPLLVAVVGSADHIAKLEDLRQNHLKSIGMLKGDPSGQTPPIAWMSYNIHGDEAASSEAAMQVLYELLNPRHARYPEILQKILVILDPCLNPDGHERYVNWYNQTRSLHADPAPFAKEHFQPWPGGRYNHYLSDLNRDWAWQVQQESRERLKLYHQWMPHLHADFHEMTPGSSYYFPPAARPFHPDITPWQREFNHILGEYNRRHFDAKGWLYFTKNNYDLFYPSYGDTWPTYNGAIGMTCEQGGGGRAGLAIARPDEGDTITLADRIAHHVAASLATLEALAAHADRTSAEFRTFFEQARTKPIGPYKSYLIKTGGAEARSHALCTLLDRQGILYGSLAKNTTCKATDLATGTVKSTLFEKGDLLISSYQPKSHLLKILFEPAPVLEDSLTYDITSWGLSFAYGLKAFGTEEKLTPVTGSAIPVANPVTDTPPYAYLVKWESWRELAFLSELLKNNIRVRTARTRFEADGVVFPEGSLVITRTGNERTGKRFGQLIPEWADKHQVRLYPVYSGMVEKGFDLGSDHVSVIRSPRVVLAGGKGVSPTAFGEVWHYFEQQIGFPITVTDAERLRDLPWSRIDILILPDGDYGQILDESLLSAIREWIVQGGKVIAMEGALRAFTGKPGFELSLKAELRKDENPLKSYGDREREVLRDDTPGSIYEVTLDTTHPLAYGYRSVSYYSLVRHAYQYAYLSHGWNVGRLDNNAHVAGFVGDRAKSNLRNTLIFGCQEIGWGQAIYMADNPLFRGFWLNSSLLFGNAVFR